MVVQADIGMPKGNCTASKVGLITEGQLLRLFETGTYWIYRTVEAVGVQVRIIRKQDSDFPSDVTFNGFH